MLRLDSYPGVLANSSFGLKISPETKTRGGGGRDQELFLGHSSRHHCRDRGISGDSAEIFKKLL